MKKILVEDKGMSRINKKDLDNKPIYLLENGSHRISIICKNCKIKSSTLMTYDRWNKIRKIRV